MARIRSRAISTPEVTLTCTRQTCPACDGPLWADYDNFRAVVSLGGATGYRLKVRRCSNQACSRYHVPYRPEAEGRLALPQHEFGLDVIALIGSLRYSQHRSVPEIAEELRRRHVDICERSVTNLLDRYDELVAVSVMDNARLRTVLEQQGRVILAIDGLQPDVGHEVLWVVRDCLSGEVLRARPLLSARVADLEALLTEVTGSLQVPVAGVVSDGQHSIRKAVQRALSGVPHQLCHFHYLREAARPLYEADRHAKKELKKLVRGVRPIERELESQKGSVAEAGRGYCSAVRSALTDDGRPPLDPSGLKLQQRLTQIEQSLRRALAKKGEPSTRWPGSTGSCDSP